MRGVTFASEATRPELIIVAAQTPTARRVQVWLWPGTAACRHPCRLHTLCSCARRGRWRVGVRSTFTATTYQREPNLVAARKDKHFGRNQGGSSTTRDSPGALGPALRHGRATSNAAIIERAAGAKKRPKAGQIRRVLLIDRNVGRILGVSSLRTRNLGNADDESRLFRRRPPPAHAQGRGKCWAAVFW